MSHGGKAQALHTVLKVLFLRRMYALDALAALDTPLSPMDVLLVLAEIADGVHDMPYRFNGRVAVARAWGEQLATVLQSEPAAVEAWAVADLEKRLAAPGARPAWHAQRRLEALLHLKPGPLEARFVPLVQVTSRPEDIHLRITPEQLEARVFEDLRAQAVALGEPKKGWGIGFARPATEAAHYLGLCASERLVQLVLGLGGLSGIWDDTEKAVAAHKGQKVVARTLRAFRTRVARIRTYPSMRAAVADWIAPAFPEPPQTGKKPARAKKRK